MDCEEREGEASDVAIKLGRLDEGWKVERVVESGAP